MGARGKDPRVTRVGAIIRKLCGSMSCRKVINVLRGHMSFVGPRPSAPGVRGALAEKLRSYVPAANCVKPAINGWAQAVAILTAHPTGMRSRSCSTTCTTSRTTSAVGSGLLDQHIARCVLM